MTEWISAREACALLANNGISRKMGRRLLLTGLAGAPVRTSSATLFDAARLHALVARPVVDVDAMPRPCDRALLELRVAPEAGVTDWSRIGNAGPLVRAHLRAVAQRHGFLPTVVSSCGFVRGGFEALDARPVSGTEAELICRPAGVWFDHFRDRRLPTSPGNPWRLWLQPEVA